MNDDSKIELAAYGSEVKALGNGRLGGYLVRFGSQNDADVEGDFFTADTDFGAHATSPVLYHHGMDAKIGTRVLDDGASLKADDVGVWIEAQLKMRDEYERAIYRMAEKGKLGWSSGTAPHLVEREEVGKAFYIKRWPLGLDASLTPIPCEPHGTQVVPIKSLVGKSLDALLAESEPVKEPRQSAARAGRKASGAKAHKLKIKSGGLKMNEELFEKIKTLVPGLTEEQIAALEAVLGLVIKEAAGDVDAASEAVDNEEYMAKSIRKALEKMGIKPVGKPVAKPVKKARGRKMLGGAELLDKIRELVPGLSEEQISALEALLGLVMDVVEEAVDEAGAESESPAVEPESKSFARPPYRFGQGAEQAAERPKGLKAMDAVHIMKFGPTDEPTDVVMREVYEGDYNQVIHDQMKSFIKYVRGGERALDREDDKRLRRQLWAADNVKAMLLGGLGVDEIKTTMIEGADVLGGYAVPPQVSNEIISRLNGLTSIRGGGAMVVQTASKQIEWLQITGGNTQFRSGLRGAWGTETQTPDAKNFTLGLMQIPVNIYTYKVGLSVSLIEDAGNIVQILQNLITDTLAIDEDNVFIDGDGAGKPRGILPGDANADSLEEINTGDANYLQWAGLQALRRGIASQYRANMRASLIGNSATGLAIEQLVDGMSRPYVDQKEGLVAGETRIMSAIWRENESLADVAASAFPLIFADLSGYCIVERLGLAIQRYNDSYTGVNVTEFHVRRRIGGRVIEPWKFAIQKVSA